MGNELKFAPEQASNFAREYDALFYVITALTVVFTILVFLLVVFMISKYKRGKVADRSNPVHHNTKVEIILVIVPLFLGLAVFVWGTKIFIHMREIPKDAMEIFVVGKRWMWHVQHSNGVRENNELHVPVGQAVKLTMISQDVIHSFYIPQFRIQYHVVPGRYTSQWFIATKPGKFNLFCTIHCGTQHSEMGGYVYAMEPADFAKWLENGGNRFKPIPTSMVESGKALWELNNCGSCHGVQDTKRGPSILGIAGQKRIMASGAELIADRAYLRDSIMYPEANLLKNYINSMPNYSQQFNEDQVNQLVEYIQSQGKQTEAAPVKPVAAATGGNR